MTFRQFEYIWTLIQEGSFTKVADKLFISVSALSQQISAIEKEYGVTIINRKTKPLSLTNEGYIIYEAAEKVLGIKNNMEKELQHGERVKLYIKTIEFFSYTIVPRIMALMREKHPNAEMKIIDAATEKLFTDQYYENVDLYIHAFDMLTNTEEINEKDDKYVHEEIGVERMLLAVSKNNPFYKTLESKDTSIDLRLLKDASFIGTSTSNYLEFICKKLCFELGGYEPNYTRAEPTIVKILSYLQYNNCWAILPDSVAKYYNFNEHIQLFTIEGSTFKRPIIASYPRRNKIPQAVKDSILLAKEMLKEEYFGK